MHGRGALPSASDAAVLRRRATSTLRTMRRLLALILAVVGLWFLVPGVLSFTQQADAAPVPPMGTSAILGGVLLVVAAVLARGRTGARRSAPTS